MSNKIINTKKIEIQGTDITQTFRDNNGLPQQDFSVQNGNNLEPIFTQKITAAPQNTNTAYSIVSSSDLHALGNSLASIHLKNVVQDIKDNHAWNGVAQEDGKIKTSVNGEILTL